MKLKQLLEVDHVLEELGQELKSITWSAVWIREKTAEKVIACLIAWIESQWNAFTLVYCLIFLALYYNLKKILSIVEMRDSNGNVQFPEMIKNSVAIMRLWSIVYSLANWHKLQVLDSVWFYIIINSHNSGGTHIRDCAKNQLKQLRNLLSPKPLSA